MPARSGHTHSEDLPWLEVPSPIPAAEKESDRGGSMVPPICGEALLRNSRLQNSHINTKASIHQALIIPCLLVCLFFLNLAATKEIPEDQECHHCGAVLHQRMAGAHPPMNSLCFYNMT